jgi:hypothetical protein
MKWWKLPLILSVLWIAVVIGSGVVHTDIILKDKITKEQDSRISGVYGQICAFGLLVVWISFAIARKRK